MLGRWRGAIRRPRILPRAYLLAAAPQFLLDRFRRRYRRKFALAPIDAVAQDVLAGVAGVAPVTAPPVAIDSKMLDAEMVA